MQEFEEASRLAQIASQLQKLDEQKSQLLAAVKGEPTVRAPLHRAGTLNGMRSRRNGGAGSRGGLAVELVIKGSQPVRICERTSADTLVVLMERILANFGRGALEKLTTLQVCRGPLVTRDPQHDYLNPKKGDLYTHHRIPGTDMYVLTHSDNKQKVKDIRSALRMLGLPDGAFTVSLS